MKKSLSISLSLLLTACSWSSWNKEDTPSLSSGVSLSSSAAVQDGISDKDLEQLLDSVLRNVQ